jgi:hypothetical protein
MKRTQPIQTMNQMTTLTDSTMTSTSDKDLSRVLANRWLKAPAVKPTPGERKDFMVWLLRECQAMERDNIRPVFVTRSVSLSEVITALDRPVLPGEVKWFPVSRLFNEPNPDLMSTTQNLWFRAIHDLTHWRIGANDTMSGELSVTEAHTRTAPKSIHWILWSEVAGQAAVAIHEGEFPTQKLCKII